MPDLSSDSDSSSGSSNSSRGSHRKGSKVGKSKKDKKDKKDKKTKVKHEKKKHLESSSSSDPRYRTSHTFPTPQLPPGYIAPIPPLPVPDPTHQPLPPPDYGSPQSFYSNPPPPSGYRIPLVGNQAFPADARLGHPPTADIDGTPVYIGSALLGRSVHPCKIVPNLNPPARVPYAGEERGHHDRYDLLPFVPEQMEFIQASHGLIPEGRRPVEGGYEEDGSQLYHGIANIQGVRVPGKVGRHLDGCNAPFGGEERHVDEYELLVWKR